MIDSTFVCTKTAARYLNLSYRTLENYRQRQKGPQYVRCGEKLIRYRVEDLDRWLAEHNKRS